MTEVPTPLKSLSEIEQAIYFHARERRRSLAGVPELNRTRIYPISTSPVLATEFPNRDILYTFWTVIRITDTAPAGLVFELGNATTAVAAWIDDDTIGFRAGDTGDDAAIATFVNGPGTLPVGLELDLVCSVRPGDGRVRVWGNGQEIARGTAVNGQLPNGFAAASNGAFAAAAVGALPADVTEAGAPSDFDVVEPLSVFRGQVPRHFV